MRLILSALRRPITVIVAVLALALTSWIAVRRMHVDIFPSVGSPVIYVAQPYGGMDPSQMEGFLTYYYEYHFLYITGIEHVESKSIQGAALMKLVFHGDTDMNQAMAETVGYVNRARAFMPPGAVPPFITRFDAGSVAVAQLILSSDSRTPGEMQDFAINRVRPLFATLPGVSAPPPFGGNQRTIVVRLNPDRLRQYRISPEEAVGAVNRSSALYPSGVVRTGDFARIANTNAVIGGNLQELMDAPVRTGSGPTVYIRDIAVVENGTDIITAYAHVNGKRTVYIPVTKRADASTLDVMRNVRNAMPAMQNVLPEDVKLSIEFDQTGFVERSLRDLVTEGLSGALLTGLTVLLFLKDWRSAVIVLATIPFALLGATLGLWLSGQTLNIMTLAGLALAVGVLVDEATVEIENIHSQMASGLSRPRSVVDACRRTAIPRLLAMTSMIAVFVPSAYFMSGVAKQLFVPLSLAVGFAMISSYLLSSSLVPVLSVWVLRGGHGPRESNPLYRLYRRYVEAIVGGRWLVIAGYLAAAGVVLLLFVPRLGTELFPAVDAGQFQLRMRAPVGTRVERTEMDALRMLDTVKQVAGAGNIAVSTAFIGVQPASYPINLIHLWTSGPHEAVLRVALTPAAKLRGEALLEELRKELPKALPACQFTFEAGDIVSQVMSFGAPTPIEVAVQGPDLGTDRAYAEKVRAALVKIPELRDLELSQPLDYPTLDVNIDRERAGQYGLTAANVARSVVEATSSSRFTEPNFWRDPVSGNGFQIQVEIPQYRIQSAQDVENIPLMKGGENRPLLSDVAVVKPGVAPGMVERYNMQRVISYTVNVHGTPLGELSGKVRAALAKAGEVPRGVTVAVRGQVPVFEETFAGLRTGLLLSVATIFLLLAASFQSFRLAMAVLMNTPAVLCGVVLALVITGTTLNIQSFIGAIMAIGIAVANSILLVTFAEHARREGQKASSAAITGASGRFRAVVMTAVAMIAGMLPLAIGLGEESNQTAPLGVAVIGGLVVATFSTLSILPAMYAIVQARARGGSPSLNPEDPESRYYEGARP
jgi:multidrug efflux pump subunit AcrB